MAGVESRIIQTNFTTGEISPRLRARIDQEKYYNALRKMLNALPHIHGGCTRRTGTYFAAEAWSSANAIRLLPFIFSTTQNYVLELGDQYVRPFRQRGQVLETAVNITGATAANPVVITAVAHGYSNGDKVFIESVLGMTQLNGRQFTVANVTANTFELSGINGTGYTAYSSGGTTKRVYKFAIPWTAAQLVDLKFTQSADTLYITHPSYSPRKITRTSDTAWTVTDMRNLFRDGPYLSLNLTATTITPSGTTGAITLTASAALWVSTDVDRLVRILHGSTWGYARITGYTSSTVVNATVVNAFGATTASANWRLGAWSDTTGWPSVVTLFQERSIWGATTSNPQTIWGSRTGDFEDMAPTDTAGVVTDSHAFTFTISDDQVNAIRWLSAGKTVIQVGTSGSEHILYGGNSAGAFVAITPTNVTISRETTHGSVSNVRPQRIGKELMFVQASRRKVRASIYDYQSDAYSAKDITLLAEHITSGGIIDLDYQEELIQTLWMVKTDGSLIGLTYDKIEDVRGWHKHILGGAFGTGQAVVESISVIPSPTAIFGKDLWVAVKRTINGSTVRHIEYISEPFDPDNYGQNSAFFVDSGLTYDGYLPAGITLSATSGAITITASSAVFTSDMVGREIHAGAGIATITGFTSTTVIDCTVNNTFSTTTFASGAWAVARKVLGGLWHLEGQSCQVCTDGANHPNVTISSGTFTLDGFYSKVHCGLGYTTDIETLPPHVLNAESIEGLAQRYSRVHIYFYRTLGAKFGPNVSKLEELPFRVPLDPMNVAPPLFTGIKRVSFPSGYEDEQVVYIRQNYPLPLSILFIAARLSAQE